MSTITTDPIADLLTRIRNASKARKDVVSIPHSKMKLDILKLLKDRGFIGDFKTVKNGKFEEIEVSLSADRPQLTLKRISKPGQRIYVKSTSLKKVNGGLGLAIVSTPKGIVSGDEAKKMKVGGELLCEIF
jgi:small subunit ribosomal protein S8